MKNYRPLIFFLFVFTFIWSGCQKKNKEENKNNFSSKQHYKKKPNKRDIYKNYLGDKKTYYGASYYPEAWDMKGVDQDIKRMKECNMNVVRMAEFAWSKMEPKEDHYNFEWLHKVIEKLHASGIDVILGTPTATPPGWMAEKYPEIFVVREDGTRKTHGARRNCSFTSKKYLELSNEIVEKMAQEFGNKEGVIGWQIDNELHINEDYSKQTEQLWTKWLKKRYKTIDSLNNLWNLSLWSQTYSSFDMIPMPRDYVWHHPSLKFAWYKFNVQNVLKFQNNQVQIIRKHSDLPITHDSNSGASFDYKKMFRPLDFAAVNNYHSFEAYDRVFSNYDRMRNIKEGFFWLTETAPNYSGGGKEGRTWFLHQPEGSFHAALWMNYALGGQGSLFWLWKQHYAGQEMPHGSVISSWNKKAANYADIKKLGRDLRKASDFLMNNPVAEAEIGIFYSNISDKGFDIEEYTNGISYYKDWTFRFYHSLTDVYLHRDVIYQDQNIKDYKILFAPLMPYISKNARRRWKEWVKNGGILILGPMSGYRTKEWTSFTNHALGSFGDWTGIEVKSRIPVGASIREKEVPMMLDYADHLNISETQASLWSEALSSENGKVLATYKNLMHKNEPAIIENKVGKGKVVILGCDPGKKALSHLMLKYASEKNIKPIAKGDPGVIVAPRDGENSGYVVDNITTKKKTITLPKGGKDILSGKNIPKKLNLKPFEVKVIKH